MGVDIPDAETERGVSVNEMQNLVICSDGDLRQVRQGAENESTPPQILQCNFTDHEGMRQNPAFIEKIGEGPVAEVQMIDPNGSIDQDHALFDRHRGAGATSGSLPPNAPIAARLHARSTL
jgi:hypothetical protein